VTCLRSFCRTRSIPRGGPISETSCFAFSAHHCFSNSLQEKSLWKSRALPIVSCNMLPQSPHADEGRGTLSLAFEGMFQVASWPLPDRCTCLCRKEGKEKAYASGPGGSLSEVAQDNVLGLGSDEDYFDGPSEYSMTDEDLGDALRKRFDQISRGERLPFGQQEDLTGMELAEMCVAKYGVAYDMAMKCDKLQLVSDQKLVSLNLYYAYYGQLNPEFPYTGMALLLPPPPLPPPPFLFHHHHHHHLLFLVFYCNCQY
jgi:hypothetical protein